MEMQAVTFAAQMFNLILVLFLTALIIGGTVALQIFLSNKKIKWLGLILPMLTFLPSLFILLQIATVGQDTNAILAMLLPIFLVLNIPTAILLIIYAVCRQNYKAKQEIEKMNIQDL